LVQVAQVLRLTVQAAQQQQVSILYLAQSLAQAEVAVVLMVVAQLELVVQVVVTAVVPQVKQPVVVQLIKVLQVENQEMPKQVQVVVAQAQ
jgi:hypothetical protein